MTHLSDYSRTLGCTVLCQRCRQLSACLVRQLVQQGDTPQGLKPPHVTQGIQGAKQQLELLTVQGQQLGQKKGRRGGEDKQKRYLEADCVFGRQLVQEEREKEV